MIWAGPQLPRPGSPVVWMASRGDPWDLPSQLRQGEVWAALVGHAVGPLSVCNRAFSDKRMSWHARSPVLCVFA